MNGVLGVSTVLSDSILDSRAYVVQSFAVVLEVGGGGPRTADLSSSIPARPDSVMRSPSYSTWRSSRTVHLVLDGLVVEYQNSRTAPRGIPHASN